MEGGTVDAPRNAGPLEDRTVKTRALTSWLLAGLAAALLGAGALVRVDGGEARSVPEEGPATLDLTPFSPAPPGAALDLLFIHHSCGGQLLADEGAERSASPSTCIYDSHPNGGGLRARLTRQGYQVHEASYGSVLGERTDLFDWLPKFRAQMAAILGTAHQDEPLPPGRSNRIVLFKSCFPNNLFRAEGAPPGDPNGPELTVWNARATFSALLPLLAQHPDVLFVYVTAPAVAPRLEPTSLARAAIRRARGQGSPVEELERSARLARELDDWLVGTDGWLADYPGKNVVVFDYYDLLTGKRRSNLSVYATAEGGDSHPSAEGHRVVSEELVPFLNRAVRRAGLVP
jgi:hypothetical protein